MNIEKEMLGSIEQQLKNCSPGSCVEYQGHYYVVTTPNPDGNKYGISLKDGHWLLCGHDSIPSSHLLVKPIDAYITISAYQAMEIEK